MYICTNLHLHMYRTFSWILGPSSEVCMEPPSPAKQYHINLAPELEVEYTIIITFFTFLSSKYHINLAPELEVEYTIIITFLPFYHLSWNLEKIPFQDEKKHAWHFLILSLNFIKFLIFSVFTILLYLPLIFFKFDKKEIVIFKLFYFSILGLDLGG